MEKEEKGEGLGRDEGKRRDERKGEKRGREGRESTSTNRRALKQR